MIIGYNDSAGAAQTGSHNLVIGDRHQLESYGGIVAGFNNAITALWASVTGGSGDHATGPLASVTGGEGSLAAGHAAAVSGGFESAATGEHASVSGGTAGRRGPARP